MHVLSQRIPFRICMHAKKIDLMSQILQQNNLGDHIPEGAKKKKPKDLNSKKGNSSHALISINSSPDAWIIDSGESHHMAASKEVYSSLDACKGPPILMGDNSSVEVTDKGRIELTNGSFENVLHVPKLSVNLLSMYQMTNSSTGKKVIFTPNFMDIYDMKTNSRVATGEVNHQSRLYTFSEFIEPDSALLLTHADESSRIWHERFGHLNFRYMQQLSKKILVDGLPNIHFSKGVCEGCVLGKHPQEKFDKGKSQRASAPLDLIHSDLMGPFPHPSIKKRGLFSFLLMISHVLHGSTFSGKNLRSFNTSKISKPWLRHSPERRSKSSKLITGESM
jgi:hypothetical protein